MRVRLGVLRGWRGLCAVVVVGIALAAAAGALWPRARPAPHRVVASSGPTAHPPPVSVGAKHVITYADLRNITLDVPDWPEAAGCPSGRLDFWDHRHPRVTLTEAPNGAGHGTWVDVNADGVPNLVVLATCSSGAEQVIVLARGSDGHVVVLGQVTGTPGATSHTEDGYTTTESTGVASVQPADDERGILVRTSSSTWTTNGSDADGGDGFDELHRYQWSRGGFVRADGPIVAGYRTTASDVTVHRSGSGWSGTLVVTVRNDGSYPVDADGLTVHVGLPPHAVLVDHRCSRDDGDVFGCRAEQPTRGNAVTYRCRLRVAGSVTPPEDGSWVSAGAVHTEGGNPTQLPDQDVVRFRIRTG